MNIYSSRFLLFFGLLTGLFVYAAGLPVPLMANAAKYAQVSREIIENNDWINLTIGGDSYDQKPPLLFWIGAAFFYMFGISTIIYKISVVLISTLGIYSTYKLGTILYNKNTGLLAAIFWGTSVGYLHFHNDIHTDSLLATVVVFSVWQLTAYFQTKKWYQFVFGIAGVGLSMLTKGPVGLFIPAVAIGFQLLFQKKYNEIFNLRWILAVIIIAVIISPALIGLLNQFGIEGIKFYFWTNNMGRITGSYAGTNTDPTFYLHNSLYMLAPWTIFAFTGIVHEIKYLYNVLKDRAERHEVINLAAIIPYFIILSLAKAKNPHYMLAIMPFMAILGSKWAIYIFDSADYLKMNKAITITNKVLTIVLLVIPMFIASYIYPETKIFYWFVMCMFIVACLYFVVIKIDFRKQIIMLIIAGAGLIFAVNVNIFPKMISNDSSIDAATYFNENAGSTATLNIFGQEARLWSLFLYSEAPGKFIITKDDMKKFLPRPGAWVYTSEKDYIKLKEMNVSFEIIKVYKHKTLTRQSLKFLNPKTREQHFDKMYLLKLN